MTDTVETLTCANHPNIETGLRCRICEKPICAKCAVLTPTGYKCRECVRGQQKVFETTHWYDYPLTLLISGGLSFFGSVIASYLGFFTIFIAPIAGTIIAEVVRKVTNRRRSKRLFQIAAIATAAGALPMVLAALFPVLAMLSRGGIGFWGILPLLWQILYAFIATSTMYYRLAGIRV
jgi:hypothetical protein